LEKSSAVDQNNWLLEWNAARVMVFSLIVRRVSTARGGEIDVKLKIQTLFVVAWLMHFSSSMSFAETYDLVIANGQVIDPEAGLDEVRNVGVKGGTIAALSVEPLEGKVLIDATGKIVSPGFIDIHSHSPSQLGAHFQLLDGVTTQLDLEAGAFPVVAYGEHFTGGAPLNFGASVAHFAVRIKVIEGREQPYLFSGFRAMGPGAAFVQVASAEQVEEMRGLLRKGLADGGLGIGMLLDYMSDAVSPEELRMVFEVAAENEVPLFVHVKRGFAGDPAGLLEVVELAEKTGAALLVNHINHSAMQDVGEWLEVIDAANSRGANITTETLSYAAGGTSISAAVFSRDWRKIFNITYEDVQWTATGEWLTEETWNKYRTEQPTGMINHHYVKEEWIEEALKWPGMMVSSDVTPALVRDTLANPNVGGTFSRLLGHYARERRVLSLRDAIRRVTLLPAQWMAQASDEFSRKGRVQVGADADLAIFDPDAIQEKATYGDPYLRPAGISHVIVGGQVVVDATGVVVGRYPGRRILGDVQEPDGVQE
jgi:N-acyl-D-aspartate/D-glutamate deacylase